MDDARCAFHHGCSAPSRARTPDTPVSSDKLVSLQDRSAVTRRSGTPNSNLRVRQSGRSTHGLERHRQSLQETEVDVVLPGGPSLHKTETTSAFQQYGQRYFDFRDGERGAEAV